MSGFGAKQKLAILGAAKARVTTPLCVPNPRGDGPLRAGQFPAFQIERAAWLHRICFRILPRIHRGECQRQVFRHFARIWHGKQFRSDRSKRWQLSPDTLRRLYFSWLDDQRPETFLPRYKPGVTPIPRALLSEFLRRCALPGTLTIAAARDSLARDLQHGDFLPGFGKLVDWLRRHPKLRKGNGHLRLPFCARSFSRAITPAQHAAGIRLLRLNRQTAAARSVLARATDGKSVLGHLNRRKPQGQLEKTHEPGRTPQPARFNGRCASRL